MCILLYFYCIYLLAFVLSIIRLLYDFSLFSVAIFLLSSCCSFFLRIHAERSCVTRKPPTLRRRRILKYICINLRIVSQKFSMRNLLSWHVLLVYSIRVFYHNKYALHSELYSSFHVHYSWRS